MAACALPACPEGSKYCKIINLIRKNYTQNDCHSSSALFGLTNSVYQSYMPGTPESSEWPCEGGIRRDGIPGDGTRNGAQSTCNIIACRNRVNITQIRGYWQVPGRATA